MTIALAETFFTSWKSFTSKEANKIARGRRAVLGTGVLSTIWFEMRRNLSEQFVTWSKTPEGGLEKLEVGLGSHAVTPASCRPASRYAGATTASQRDAGATTASQQDAGATTASQQDAGATARSERGAARSAVWLAKGRQRCRRYERYDRPLSPPLGQNQAAAIARNRGAGREDAVPGANPSA